MAVSTQDIVNFLKANPNMDDAAIVKAMETYKISPAQMAQATGLSEGQISARVAATIPPGMSVTLGDTVIIPQYRTTGSGMDEQIGALEGFATSKTNGDPNYKAPVGTPMQIYSADGQFVNTVKTKKDQSFFGGLVDAFKDPVVQAAILGVAGGAGAFDGLFSGSGAAGAAGAAGTSGMTAAELAQLDLALGGAGGTAGAESLAAALTTGADVATLTNLTGGSGLLTGAEAGITTQSVADKLAADAAAAGTASVLPTGTVVPTTAVTDALTTAAGSTLTTSQILDLLKAGISLAAITSLTGSGNTGTGTTGTATSIPTQGVPLNNQDYYNAIQQSYNQMMPNAPRNVVSPLQQWYSNEFSPSAGFTTAGLFGKELAGASTGTGNTPTSTAATVSMQPMNAVANTATTPATTMPVSTPALAPTPPTTVTKPAATVTTTSPASTTGLMSGNQMTPQAQVAALLNNPNLQGLPESASAAISGAINNPRSYQDVINSGSVNKVDLSTLTPEQQKAYDVFQQSQVLGVPTPIAEAAYKAAGVDPTNPSAFFDKLGLETGMPTKEALARYAPLALSEFGKTGGGTLTFTIDPNTLPADYKAPTDVNTYSSFEANRLRTSFDDILNNYANSIRSISSYSPAMQQQFIDEKAAELNDIYANKIRY